MNLKQKILLLIPISAVLTIGNSLNQEASGTARNSWLFIGDSHSASNFGDGFREEIFELGMANEKEFFQLSVSGSSAAHWLYGMLDHLSIDSTIKLPGKDKKFKTGRPGSEFKDFETLNKSIQPQTLVFELGTNDAALYLDKIKAQRMPASIPLEPLPKDLEGDPMGRPLFFMRRLLNINLRSRCAFILPARVNVPSMPEKEYRAFNLRLAAEAEKRRCVVVDSEKIGEPKSSKPVSRWEDCLMTPQDRERLTPDRPDGIHFRRDKGVYWGQCAALLLKKKWATQELNHPKNR